MLYEEGLGNVLSAGAVEIPVGSLLLKMRFKNSDDDNLLVSVTLNCGSFQVYWTSFVNLWKNIFLRQMNE